MPLSTIRFYVVDNKIIKEILRVYNFSRIFIECLHGLRLKITTLIISSLHTRFIFIPFGSKYTVPANSRILFNT